MQYDIFKIHIRYLPSLGTYLRNREMINGLNRVIKKFPKAFMEKILKINTICLIELTSNSKVSDPAWAIFTTSECDLSNTLIPEMRKLVREI